MASSALEHLLHSATAINVRGVCYRMKNGRHAESRHSNPVEAQADDPDQPVRETPRPTTQRKEEVTA